MELIEVKLSEKSPTKSLLYYAEKLKVNAATQIVANLKNKESKGKFRAINPIEFFSHKEFQF